MNVSWLVVMAMVGMPQKAEMETVAEVIAYLHARNAQIQDMTCRYEVQSEASEQFAATYAKQAGMSTEEALRNFKGTKLDLFEETRSGLFRLESTQHDAENVPSFYRVMYYDGDETYLGVTPLRTGKLATPSFQVKGKIRKNYETESLVRRIFGDSALPISDESYKQSPPLYWRLEQAEAAEMLPREKIGEAECVVIRWRSQEDQLSRRETVWLDLEHGLALRKYQEENAASPGSEEWRLVIEWEVPELGSSRMPGATEDMQIYWYPKIVREIGHDGEGGLTLSKTIEVTSLEFNTSIPKDRFTPRIEDGSNVIDATTGIGFVYGGKLSPRLRTMVEERVAESRRDLASRDNPDMKATADPPRSRIGNALSWAALGCGVFGLVVAVWLRRQS